MQSRPTKRAQSVSQKTLQAGLSCANDGSACGAISLISSARAPRAGEVCREAASDRAIRHHHGQLDGPHPSALARCASAKYAGHQGLRTAAPGYSLQAEILLKEGGDQLLRRNRRILAESQILSNCNLTRTRSSRPGSGNPAAASATGSFRPAPSRLVIRNRRNRDEIKTTAQENPVGPSPRHRSIALSNTSSKCSDCGRQPVDRF